jgi:hypothetical protein
MPRHLPEHRVMIPVKRTGRNKRSAKEPRRNVSKLTQQKQPSTLAFNLRKSWYADTSARSGQAAHRSAGTTGSFVMRKLRIIAVILSTLAGLSVSVTLATNAYACPGGYVPCGPGCCPGR